MHLQIENAISSGFIFAKIEALKLKEPIGEYTCSQSSLESIFNDFAKKDSALID